MQPLRSTNGPPLSLGGQLRWPVQLQVLLHVPPVVFGCPALCHFLRAAQTRRLRVSRRAAQLCSSLRKVGQWTRTRPVLRAERLTPTG